MAASATLPAVSLTTTNNSSIDSNKRKSEEKINLSIGKTSTQRRIPSPKQSANETDNSLTGSIPIFRIPKIGRLNKNISSPPDQNQLSPKQVKMEINDNTLSSSSQVINSKPNSSPNRQLNDELNSQQGKRKFSLSQYKEHKRLKSSDIVSNSFTDIDMRMDNNKNSPPTPIDDNSSIVPDNQSVVSPKMDDISKDLVIKSNLSEPGVKKLIKKKVIWADEKNQSLVQTSFFEIDDSEVIDMHAFARQCATNMSIAQVEKLMERELGKRQGLQDMNSLDNDDRQNLPPLPNLIRVLLPETIVIPKVESQERIAQEEREKIVLQALFIRKFLPDSPGEPDGDLLGNSTIERNEPKLIPIESKTSKSAPDQEPAVNNNSTSITPTPAATPSLSSLSLDNISPEVAQILAQAKGNLTSATTSNPSPAIVNTQINPPTIVTSTNPPLVPIPNLSTTTSLLSALLNATRSNGTEAINIPPTNPIANHVQNLPVSFNIPPPTPFSIHQLLATAVSLGMLPPPTFNNPILQPSPITFSTPPPSSISTTMNSNNNSAIKSPAARFDSPLGQQSSRFNNYNEHYNTASHENNRGRNYRRGFHNNNNNNNNNRHNYYQNRNNTNNKNNNRNIFS